MRAGGVYIGVGPDQSFSYIAKIRPRLADHEDIRRDNLLQHLCSSLCSAAPEPDRTICASFFGKPFQSQGMGESQIKELIDYIDAPPLTRVVREELKDVRQTFRSTAYRCRSRSRS